MSFRREWLNQGLVLAYRVETLNPFVLVDWSNQVIETIHHWKPEHHYLILYDLSNPKVSLPYLVLTGRELFNVGLTATGKVRIQTHLERLKDKNLYFALVISSSASSEVMQKYQIDSKSDKRITGKLFFNTNHAVQWLVAQNQSAENSITRPLDAQSILKTIKSLNAQNSDVVEVHDSITLLINNAVEVLEFPESGKLVIGRRSSHRGTHESEIDLDLSGYGTASYSVSGRHALLSVQENYLYVTDLNSTNGTYVSGRRLKPGIPYVVRRNDTILLGSISISILF